MNKKTCSKCGEIKPFDQFRVSRQRKDGRQCYCRSCHAKANSVWRSKHRARHLATVRKWHSDNRDKSRAANRAWTANNRKRRRNIDQARRTRLNNNGVFLVLDKEIRRIHGSPCANCGAKDNITVDHILPISRGGRHSIGNLQPLCKPCNSSKKDRLMVEWRSVAIA